MIQDPMPSKDHLKTLILFSTFSNQIDLSMTAGSHQVSLDHTNFDVFNYTKDLLNNDLDGVCDYIAQLSYLTTKTCHLVIDNCGLEFFSDLCFGLYLLTTSSANEVVFHIKVLLFCVRKFPTFVSDVTSADITYMSSFLYDSNDPDLIKVQDLMSEYVESGKIIFRPNLSWNFSHHYSDLLTAWSQFSEIHESFKESSLVVFKGDLNYRRLCGELNWDIDTPMSVMLQNFKNFPLLILRTVKSVSICGIESDMVDRVKNLDENWYINGEKGQIIFINHKLD
ncbi:hypothetical protein RF11_12135 [Thelohanellus kitauei]|uniref:Sugar phosphate phosphatase n=1 Tax=Thelohanellus kitauei TaxID=669202 RepID=A0A0C2M7F4_THEKT|nr:hypothetical protein RF11_12135 [Thelohanellus kitauei]